MNKTQTISILMPVYNEEAFLESALEKVISTRISGLQKEIIVINDGSTDGTDKILRKFKKIKTINLSKNSGKGSAIKKGLESLTGDLVVIQDADLEYDPGDLELLVKPILDGDADVVYGSRFMGDRPHRVHFFWHMVANNLLTLLSNMFTNLNLTDMETGYKMFTKKVAKSIKLEENRFGMEPEFTAKIAKMKCRVFEVGISYHGRGYDEGKKIGWKDGVHALWCILKYNLFV